MISGSVSIARSITDAKNSAASPSSPICARPPTKARFRDLLRMVAEADVVEVGVPFSDDGRRHDDQDASRSRLSRGHPSRGSSTNCAMKGEVGAGR